MKQFLSWEELDETTPGLGEAVCGTSWTWKSRAVPRLREELSEAVPGLGEEAIPWAGRSCRKQFLRWEELSIAMPRLGGSV